MSQKSHYRFFFPLLLSIFIFFSCYSTQMGFESNNKSKKTNNPDKTENSKLEVTSYNYDNFLQQYNILVNENSSELKEELLYYLNNWESEDSSNCEMLKANALYYVFISTNYVEKKTFDQPEGDIIYTITIDPYTNQNIYNYKEEIIDLRYLYKAIDYVEKGLELYPDRIDLWSFLLDIYDSIEMYQEVEESSYYLFNRLLLNDNKWLGYNNQPLDTGSNEQNQKYFCQLFKEHSDKWLSTKTVTSLNCCNNVLSSLLEIFPNNTLLLSNLGLCSIYLEDFSKATLYFESALAQEPENLDIIFNLAYTGLIGKNMDQYQKYSRIILDSDNIELKASLQKLYNSLSEKK